jgi:hypothetical protein
MYTYICKRELTRNIGSIILPHLLANLDFDKVANANVALKSYKRLKYNYLINRISILIRIITYTYY